MFLSIGLILLFSISLSSILIKLRIPGLIAMLITGILLGPYVLDLIDEKILNISAELREIALIVILLRAGLSLDIQDLKKVGRPAILLCFIPATVEIIIITFLAPLLFSISYLEAAIMGAVLAAVSPAVIVPRMIKLMETKYGDKKSIPQLVLAGASVDDIYVIVLFASFIQMYQGAGFSIIKLVTIPITIFSGIILGIICGLALVWFFKKIHIRDTIKVLIIFSFSFLFIVFEDLISPFFAISGLLAVMALGGTIQNNYEILAQRLVKKFEKIWVVAEIALFVLVGSAVDITVIGNIGLMAIILIIAAIIFRIIAVQLSLLKTSLNKKERLFVSISYMPKATVQAAIGAIPLSLGIASGNLILTVAVLSIIITAPIGAFLIDNTYKRLLINE